MPLQKQNLNIPFAQGLDQKTDDKQITPGKMLVLENSIFNKAGLLQKRNGFGSLPSLPDSSNTYLTTFNGNLTAIGTSLNAFSLGSQSYVNKGTIAPLDLSTLSLIKNNTNQSQCDSVVASNGLMCVVYTDITPGGILRRYAVLDSTTGQNIVSPTTFTATGSPRVFVLGNYFMVVYPNSTNLKYIAITINDPTIISAPVDISTQLTYISTNNFDGFVTNNALYLAWNGSDGGGAIRVTYISSTLTITTPVVFTGETASLMSVCADESQNPAIIWATYYDITGTIGKVLAVDQNLNTVLVPTTIISSGTILNITASASNSLLTLFYEVSNNYSYDAAIPTHFIDKNTVTQAGVVGSPAILVRSVGLASKSFILNDSIYFLSIYKSPYQNTYFLCNSSGKVVAKLAYSNGGGYLVLGLPAVTVTDSLAQFSYLFKDLVQALAKTEISSSGGIYSQTGINMASIAFGTETLNSSEIGGNLNLTGGFAWAYDGFSPQEQGFFLWPDSVETTTSGAGGLLTAQDYYYVVTYEWADNQGNIFRSAGSIPVKQTTVGATSSNTINVPTLRLTYKTANPVKIVIYRWSTAQQIYYQVTSVTSPTLNSLIIDSIAFVDILADSAILGNNILYTTGGVVENIAPPATSVITLYKSRLFLVDAEDRNLLWFSKQVIEATPVEMSDLFTLYVAPTTAAQGNTGPLTALSAMDDKLILFKKNAIYYLVGTGPDNTGANNDFSDPVFITSTVGCDNQNSIVFIPSGLIFESDKGLWLLGRDLSTTYIGAPVESSTQAASVLSSLTIPGTNQVRFTMSDGTILMYDYYYGQWGTFKGASAISSTLYQLLQTNIDSAGRVFQETPGTYLDGSSPVQMKFTTGWMNLSGLQGFQRAYFFYLLGTYLTPHKLSVQLAYDYNPASQTVVINPINFSPAYGGDPLYGSGSPYGGPSNVEQWRVFFKQQKCEAFQITIQEIYDSSFDVPAGAGLTLSGLDLVVGAKSTYPRLKAAVSVG